MIFGYFHHDRRATARCFTRTLTLPSNFQDRLAKSRASATISSRGAALHHVTNALHSVTDHHFGIQFVSRRNKIFGSEGFMYFDIPETSVQAKLFIGIMKP